MESTNFEYHTEDLDCKYCEHYKGKRKAQKHGCWEESCRYEVEKKEAAEKEKARLI